MKKKKEVIRHIIDDLGYSSDSDGLQERTSRVKWVN